MNSERLSVVIRAVKQDIEEIQLPKTLNELIAALNDQISSPNEQNQLKLSDQLNAFNAALDRSKFSTFPRTWRSTLADLDIEDLFGHALKQRVNDTIDRHPALLVDAKKGIEELKTQIEKHHQAFNQILTGFDFLKIAEPTPEPGMGELSVLMPRATFDNELKIFGQEIGVVDHLIRFMSEMTGAGREAPKIKQVSTTDPVFWVTATIPVVGGMLMLVDQILGLIQKTYGIRKVKAEAEREELSRDIIKSLEAEARKRIDNGLIDVENWLFSQFPQPRGRAEELRNESKKMLPKLAARIDNGYEIEGDAVVSGEEIEEGQEGAEERKKEIEAVKKIQELGTKIRYTELPNEPVLELPKPANEEDDNGDGE